jgi:hypothetical protein
MHDLPLAVLAPVDMLTRKTYDCGCPSINRRLCEGIEGRSHVVSPRSRGHRSEQRHWLVRRPQDLPQPGVPVVKGCIGLDMLRNNGRKERIDFGRGALQDLHVRNGPCQVFGDRYGESLVTEP